MVKSTERAEKNKKLTSDKDTNAILIGANRKLTLESCYNVGRGYKKVQLDPQAYLKIESSHSILEKFSKSRLPVYGLNTQFGNNANMLDANITNGSAEYF